jgi:hypothetical protein
VSAMADKHQGFVKTVGSASETLALLTLAYDEYAMNKSSIFEWNRWYEEG